MLYHLFKSLDEVYDLPGSGMFQYISFRAAAAVILSLLIVIIFGRRIIDFLRRKQIGEEIRDLGLEGQLQKRGIFETKIVTRFWIISLLLAAITLVTLKIR